MDATEAGGAFQGAVVQGAQDVSVAGVTLMGNQSCLPTVLPQHPSQDIGESPSQVSPQLINIMR